MCRSQGPLPSAMKVRGGSPYSQYEMLGSDSLGIPTQGTAENWHRTPGSKMGTKPATSSWPPGEHVAPLHVKQMPLIGIKGVDRFMSSAVSEAKKG